MASQAIDNHKGTGLLVSDGIAGDGGQPVSQAGLGISWIGRNDPAIWIRFRVDLPIRIACPDVKPELVRVGLEALRDAPRFIAERALAALLGRHATKKKVEINERVGKSDGQITQSVDGLFVRDTGDAVKTVRERADSAMTKAESVDSRLTHLWNNRYKRKPVDTIEVSFAFDKADLSEGAQAALLGVVKELETSPTLLVRLGGFTDLRGTRDYNYTLAQRRVEAVRRFLVKKGVELSRVQAIGMGPLDDRRIPEDQKRRVTMTLMADSPSRPGTRREVGE